MSQMVPADWSSWGTEPLSAFFPQLLHKSLELGQFLYPHTNVGEL